MKVLQTKEKSPFRQAQCEVCRKRAGVGKWVAVKLLGLDEGPAFKHYFLLHIACLPALAQRAGKDTDEEAFDAKRQEIIETGRVFNE